MIGGIRFPDYLMLHHLVKVRVSYHDIIDLLNRLTSRKSKSPGSVCVGKYLK